LTHWICTTCGVQHADTPEPAARCEICEDERQYVPLGGQQWTTLDELRAGHHADVREEEPRLTGVGCDPGFAIGQRALLVETPAGNVLWDCITLLDDELVAAVEARGGLAAIAISHPHYYSSLAAWSAAFGDVPVYIHADDSEWLRRRDAAVELWEGERHELPGGLTIIRCGGHFEGASVLHWPEGADRRGALLTGDTIQVIPDRSHVSFMRSYPNLIPLPAQAIRRIVEAVEPFVFDRIYGAWWDRVVPAGAKDAVRRSADRYVRAIRGPWA
jgi:glyoxylase-like metal-dependent hydrolase (beta-lactamase superfamily II)